MRARSGWNRMTWVLAALVAAGLARPAEAQRAPPPAPSQTAPAVAVGARPSTGQDLLAEMTVQLLKAKGIAAERRPALAGPALRQAQEAGRIDVAWEAVGASLVAVHKVADRLDAAGAYARVRELDAARGLAWLSPSRVNAGPALAMRAADARGAATLSDLAAKLKGGEALRIGCSAFCDRPEGWPALQQAYGFEVPRETLLRLDAPAVAGALRERRIDVGVVSATDARVAAYGLALLRDDKGALPSQALVPVVRREVLDRNPRIAEALGALAVRLDETVLAKLAASVEIDRKGVAEVAASFLKGMNLV